MTVPPQDSPEQAELFGDAVAIATRFLDNIETVVRGKREEIKLVLTALVCGGHVLLEDVPGTAKTVLARAIARSIGGATTTRVQCTPDLQPTDVTGLSIYNQQTRAFEFRPGPVFANVVLVDEINRAMPKTQSALLEAMAEQQVTVDGETRPLPDPFLLLASENPFEYEGTFPLPVRVDEQARQRRTERREVARIVEQIPRLPDLSVRPSATPGSRTSSSACSFSRSRQSSARGRRSGCSRRSPAAAFAVAYGYVPETRGRSIEEIQAQVGERRPSSRRRTLLDVRSSARQQPPSAT